MSTFRFETSDIPVPVTAWLERQLASKVGGCIFGLTGTGKSHAVRKAIPAGSIYVDLKSSDSLLSQRFIADMARQMGAVGEEGKPILEAFRSEGLEASLRVAERVLNGHPFVVDGVDVLRFLSANLDDPATKLWQDEKQTLFDWLVGRVNQSPTFLVGRRKIRDIDENFVRGHKAPGEWPIRLTETPDGYRNWPLLAKLADNNPAILTLARALVPLLPASAFHSLIEQASDDEVPALGLLERLGQAFQSSAPPAWQKLLSIIDALGDVLPDSIEPVLDGRADIPNSRTSYGFLMRTVLLVTQAEDQKSALELLRQQNLVESHAGRLSILPALATARAIRPLTHSERTQILPAIAHRLLASINDPRSLVPAQADRVLRAHAIFVELGDLDQAERTAILHVHGLVELARRTSRDKEYADAYRQYDHIFRMLEADEFGSYNPAGRRLQSYVRSYRTLNGSLAGRVDNATCLEDYRNALAEWPDNALWHQRVIETFIRLGRPIEAKQAMREAYEQVADHPRRDELLRARPALTAIRYDLPLLSLEFIEPILDASQEQYPDIASNCEKVLKQWETGFEFDELPFQLAPGVEGLVVFHIREKIELRKLSGGLWSARLCRPFPIESEANRPRAAIEALVSHVGTEARRLISAWTSDLSDKDIRLKGRLLSLVDALNSDIGLRHDTERWIVGRIVGKQLIPTMRDLPPVLIPDELFPESTEGLYLVQVPIYRDGVPSGPAMKIEPAGRGRGTRDLVELLRRMSEDAA